MILKVNQKNFDNESFTLIIPMSKITNIYYFPKDFMFKIDIDNRSFRIGKNEMKKGFFLGDWESVNELYLKTEIESIILENK